MPSSGGMLGNIQDQLLQEALANLGPEWQNLPIAAQIEEARRRQGMIEDIDKTTDFAVDKHQNYVQELEEMQGIQQGVSLASKRIFSLEKIAQMGFPQLAEPNAMQSGNPAEGSALPKFQDAAHLRDVLSQMDLNTALSQFGELVSINPESDQRVDDAVARFKESGDPQRQLELASIIYDSLPQSSKQFQEGSQGDDQVTGIQQRIEASNEQLRQLAIKSAQSAPKVFNKAKERLAKTAQHKGLENVMMFGPDQTRIDPFTGQLISDWHVYERNKGWGVKIPGAVGVDFEAIWRANVMDKYSQPYRNADGEYVGGYINKRFEVDRMVPEGNNYQLKPGEKRRPYLPEFRSTESRLQHMRSEAKEDDLHPTYANTEKPTDWSEDGTKFAPFNMKKSKTASTDSKKKSITKQADFFERFLPNKPQVQNPTAKLDFSNRGSQQTSVIEAPSGPKPDVDFQIDEKVEILHNGQPTGLVGYISTWEGTGFNGFSNKPSARINVKGIPGGTIVPLTDLKKITAQISLPKGGQPKDLDTMPGDTIAKGGPKCKSCGCQLPNPGNIKNQRKGNLTNCPMCNAPINFGGQWTNPVGPQQKQQPFNMNIQIQPNMQRAAQSNGLMNQTTMPSNQSVINRSVPETMQRKTKPNVPQQMTTNVLLSDENAEKTDIDHLEDVQHSANALGL